MEDRSCCAEQVGKLRYSGQNLLSKDLDGIHYGIASELQSDLENHLTFTLVDNTTMTYAQAIAAGIQIEIKYADIQDGFDKKTGEMLSKAKEISSTDSTTPVRSFYIKLTKTDSYKGQNIKKLTIDSYSTYVDVSKGRARKRDRY